MGVNLEVYELTNGKKKEQVKRWEDAYGGVDLRDEEVIEVRDSLLNAIAEKLNSDISVKEGTAILYSYIFNFLG